MKRKSPRAAFLPRPCFHVKPLRMTPRAVTWLILIVAVLAAGSRIYFLGGAGAESNDLALQQATYENVRGLILEKYVTELKKEDQEKIFYGALKGMTSSLDAHSQFLSPEQYDYLSTSTKGSFAGIGIEIGNTARGVAVLTPLLDTPAWRAGILPGDRLLKIDGKTTEGLSADDCKARIFGLPDSSVSLTLERDGSDKPFDVSMLRAVIKIHSVQAEELIELPLEGNKISKIGYVQIVQFQQHTSEELDAALKRLEARGMTALIVDLRQNLGGLLDEAGLVCDLFLKDGPIVTVIDRDAAKQRHSVTVRNVEPGKTHPDYALAILIDSQSASAAEIVSGALQDRGRATLVGDKTYGKFSVQDVIPLPLGREDNALLQSKKIAPQKVGALKLTVARYKTPKGECLDGHGIVPDFLVASSLEQQRELLISRYKRHLKDNDPRVKNGSAQPEKNGADEFNDRQLKKALEVLKEQLKR